MIAASLRIDGRRAAEFAHPEERRGFEQATVGQFLHQRPPAGIELRREGLHRREVLLVGIPAEGHAVERAERDLDERDAPLNQPPGHQAALAEASLAISLPHFVRLFSQVEGFGRPTAHQLDGPLIDGVLGDGRCRAMAGKETRLHGPPQFQAAFKLFLGDSHGRRQVVHFQLRVASPRRARLVRLEGVGRADGEGPILRTQKAGPES